MVFTLFIWIFGALSLIIAMIFYITFLWHWIPNRDGGLSGYCERKINGRLSKIVSAKVNKALEDEERRRIKADAKLAKKGEKPLGRQATLPTLFDQKDDKLPSMPMLNRNDTTTTLPQYSSRPGTPSGQPTIPGFELEQLDQKRPFPTRNATGSSVASFASNAPLMGNASDMGYGRSGSPAPSLPPLDTGFPSAPQRTMTSNSNTSQWNRGPPSRMASAMGDRGYTESPVSFTDRGPSRMASAMGDRGYTESPISFESPQSADSARPMPRAVGDLRGDQRSNTPMGNPTMGPRRMDTYGRPVPANSDYGRQSPAPSEFGRSSPAPRVPTSPTANGGYQAFNPSHTSNPSNLRSAFSASPAPSIQLPYRNMTDPTRGLPPNGDYFAHAPLPMRPGTSSSNRGPPGPGRMASPAPYQGGGRGPGSPAPGQGGYRGY